MVVAVRTGVMAYGLSCMALCHAFVVSPVSSPKTGTLDSLRAVPAAGHSRLHVESVATSEQRGFLGQSSFAGLMTAAGLVTIAAAARRRRRTSMRISLADIEVLTTDDIDVKWREKVSVLRSRRNLLVQAIRKQLDDTFFIMVWNKDGMDTDTLEEARAMFPSSVKVRVLKNALVKAAMLDSPWEPFSENLKGGNVYVFVESDEDVRGAVEAFAKLEKKFRRQQVLDGLIEKVPGCYRGWNARTLVGGVLAEDHEFLDAEQTIKLKDMPTRLELIARVAGGVKQVTQKIAVGINQLPKKIAVGTKKIVEKMEEEGKSTVSEVVA